MSNLTATAVANANLAFVKYWGKRDDALRLPTNNSISMTLSAAQTRTKLIFESALDADHVYLAPENRLASPGFTARVSAHLDRFRDLAGIRRYAEIRTMNTFPAGVGIASSASGFAALTLAASAALNLHLSERQLTVLARLGSGSACRSIPSGWVEWVAGEDSESSFAYSFAGPDHWPIRVLSVIVAQEEKQISSTDGHALTRRSPFFSARLETLPARLEAVRRAILERDFVTFGQEIEQEALSLHMVAMTSPLETGGAWQSGAYYWTPATLELLLAVQQWRRDGVPVYFTLDAGPTVHLVCPESAVGDVRSAVAGLQARQPGRAWQVLENQPAPGASLVASPA